jgi:acyl-CoA synthetase (AMP-forming)/AMP-acid ligase II
MQVFNVAHWFRRSAGLHRELPAVATAGDRIPYGALEEASNRLANALAGLGTTRGERVAVYLENRAEIVVLEIACYKAALVKTPVNFRLSPQEVVHVLDNAQAGVLVTSRARFEALAPLLQSLPVLRHVILVDHPDTPALAGSPQVHAWPRLLGQAAADVDIAAVQRDELAVLHYTSGSSGVLKAAMQTYGNRLAQLRKFLTHPDGRLARGDVLGLVGPVTHASGMQLMPALCSGAAVRLFGRFDPEEFVRAAGQERITSTFMVPTMIHMLLALPGADRSSLPALRRLGYGAAPMAPARIEEAMQRFGPVLSQGYGAGETTSGVCTLTVLDHIEALREDPRRLASCGRPYYETEVRVLDDEGRTVAPGAIGEIVVRGEDVFAGYWRAPELTAEVLIDGAYRTGDLATVDEQGYIYIVDRKKDMVITGGFNVYPTEVEAVLYQHPAVFEACVFAVPDEQWGEVVGAEVIARPGSGLDEAGLLAFCRSRLAGFKQPRLLKFVDRLPKNQNGKMARREVQAPYWAGRSRRVN